MCKFHLEMKAVCIFRRPWLHSYRCSEGHIGMHVRPCQSAPKAAQKYLSCSEGCRLFLVYLNFLFCDCGKPSRGEVGVETHFFIISRFFFTLNPRFSLCTCKGTSTGRCKYEEDYQGESLTNGAVVGVKENMWASTRTRL